MKVETEIEFKIKDYYKKITEILVHFNFNKVHSAMEHLNWEWGSEGVPTVERLKEVASDLLFDAVELYFGEGKKSTAYVATGGFYVECDDIAIQLKFELEEWYGEL